MKRTLKAIKWQGKLFWKKGINWYILLFVFVFMGKNWQSLRGAVKQFNMPPNAFGLFSVSFTNSLVLLICSLGAVALLSSVPFLTAQCNQEILRMGQKEYVLVRLIHIILISIIYTILLFLFCTVSSRSKITFSQNWGKILNTAASGNLPDEIYLGITLEPGFIVAHRPFNAALTAAGLFICVMATTGFLIFILSVFLSHKLALIIPMFLCLLDYMVEDIGLGYFVYKFSPWSYTRLDLLFSTTNPYILSKDSMVIIVIASLLVSFICCLLVGNTSKARQKWLMQTERND